MMKLMGFLGLFLICATQLVSADGIDRGNGLLNKNEAVAENAIPGARYSADKLSHKKAIVELEGNAKVEVRNKVLTADKIILNLKKATAEASGNVVYKTDKLKVDFMAK